MSKNTLCFVAGKSGGHIIPCLTLADQHCLKNPDTNILFFSTQLPLDKAIISANNNVSYHITLPLSSANVQSFFHRFVIVWNAVRSLCISFFYLLKHRPCKVITTGGVVAIPVIIAAYILRIPITLYNLDAIPGKAIKFLAPFASDIKVCFKNTQQLLNEYQCTLTPFPIRYTTNITTQNKHDVLCSIGLDTTKKTVLVLGGSQGSLFLNNCIKKWASSSYFSTHSTQIIHQTGSVDATDWKQLYDQYDVSAHTFTYHPQLATLYNVADIIICRAGAGTLFEVKFFNKQCLIIPLKTHTTSHQVDNARVMSQEYPELFSWLDQDYIEKNESLFFVKINELLINI